MQHIETSTLAAPAKTFYANVARTNHRSEAVVFIFGQMSTSGGPPRSEVVVEIPRTAMQMIVATFDALFRERLGQIAPSATPPWPEGRAENSLTCMGVLVRLVISDYMGVLDFYELVPTKGDHQIEAVVRIKSTASIMGFFVAECIAAEGARS